MAKTDIKGIMKLCADIEKKEGEGSVYSLGSPKANLKISRWSTGIEDLDAIIGGGMPEGRIVEVSGAEGSGKTTLLYHLCSRHSVCLDIPIEGTFDADRAKVFGNKPKQMLIHRARYGEQAMNKISQFAEMGIPLICVDSVPSMQPKDDVDKIKKAMKNNQDTTDLRIGGVARLLTNYLPSVEDIIEVTGTTLLFINQQRAKMNAMPFGEQTDTVGGKKLKHACSIRIQVARRQWIEIPNKNPAVTAKTEKVGMIQKMKVIKSKVSNPYGECEIPIFFDRGYVSWDDYDEVRKELMKASNEKYK